MRRESGGRILGEHQLSGVVPSYVSGEGKKSLKWKIQENL